VSSRALIQGGGEGERGSEAEGEEDSDASYQVRGNGLHVSTLSLSPIGFYPSHGQGIPETLCSVMIVRSRNVVRVIAFLSCPRSGRQAGSECSSATALAGTGT
jgi:hypothetical protein